MNPATEAVKDLLETAGYGTLGATSNWSIQINAEPNAPDTIISLFNTSGPPPEGCMDVSRKKLKSSGVSVRVRANTNLIAFARIKLVIDLLNEKGRFDTDSGNVRNMQFVQQNDEFLVEEDDNNRFIWAVDYLLKRIDK